MVKFQNFKLWCLWTWSSLFESMWRELWGSSCELSKLWHFNSTSWCFNVWPMHLYIMPEELCLQPCLCQILLSLFTCTLASDVLICTPPTTTGFLIRWRPVFFGAGCYLLCWGTDLASAASERETLFTSRPASLYLPRLRAGVKIFHLRVKTRL